MSEWTTLAMAMPLMDRPQPMVSWLLAAAAVVIVGVSKSGFGGGVGIVAVPLFVLAFGDPEPAIAALLPLLIVADIFSVYHHWGTWDRPNLRQMLPGSMVGIAIGAMLIVLFRQMGRLDEQKQVMRMAIGMICLAYPLLELVKGRYAPHWHLKPTVLGGSITGLCAGTVSTLSHAAGPVASIYLLAQHQPRQAFIGTLVLYFLIVNTVKLIPYGMLGMIDPTTLWAGLWLLPLIPVGTTLGARLNRSMNETIFRRCIFTLVVVTGIQLVRG